MSTTAAPDFARASRSCLFVAIRGDVIPMARSQATPEDTRSVTTWSTAVGEQESIGFAASVDLHAVYATTLPSGNDSVRPPQRPITSMESGLSETEDSVLTPNTSSALFLAFRGPMPLTMKNTSFAPQRAGERESATSAILRTGSPSIGEAAKM